MNVAITRQVSPNFDECELTHLVRTPIDIPLAERQHAGYEAVLASQGYRITSLPPLPGLPDSIFVEDVALVFDETAVLTRPGAVSRRLETQAIAEVLAEFRDVVTIDPPGILDGGDVLRLGRRVFVGVSSRTNAAAIRQLEVILSRWSYEVIPVPVTGCLHLKSAVTQVGENTLLLNRRWVDAGNFAGWRLIDVDPQEPGAANALYLGGPVVFPSAYPLTQACLEADGVAVLPVDVSEVLKAEGGVTCCSLVFPDSR